MDADGSPDGPAHRVEEPDRSALTWVVLVAVAVVVAVLVIVLVRRGDDEGTETTGTTASQTSQTTTSTTGTTVDGTGPTTPPDELVSAVWPYADTSRRFDAPVALTQAFATEYLGFTDPVVGEFMQGDSRSGEVEVRAVEDGPATTVLVRQLGTDGSWYVIGAASANIVIDDPQALGAIDDPLQISGQARAFEGTVEIEVRADGDPTPIGSGVVTGSGGEELGPFEGSIPFESPGGGWGAVVALTRSAEDGRVWEAAVVRVGFIGAD